MTDKTTKPEPKRVNMTMIVESVTKGKSRKLIPADAGYSEPEMIASDAVTKPDFIDQFIEENSELMDNLSKQEELDLRIEILSLRKTLELIYSMDDHNDISEAIKLAEKALGK